MGLKDHDFGQKLGNIEGNGDGMIDTRTGIFSPSSVIIYPSICLSLHSVSSSFNFPLCSSIPSKVPRSLKALTTLRMCPTVVTIVDRMNRVATGILPLISRPIIGTINKERNLSVRMMQRSVTLGSTIVSVSYTRI